MKRKNHDSKLCITFVWPRVPNNYSSKIIDKCTRTDWNAIWWYFALIQLLFSSPIPPLKYSSLGLPCGWCVSFAFSCLLFVGREVIINTKKSFSRGLLNSNKQTNNKTKQHLFEYHSFDEIFLNCLVDHACLFVFLYDLALVNCYVSRKKSSPSVN